MNEGRGWAYPHGQLVEPSLVTALNELGICLQKSYNDVTLGKDEYAIALLDCMLATQANIVLGIESSPNMPTFCVFPATDTATI